MFRTSAAVTVVAVGLALPLGGALADSEPALVNDGFAGPSQGKGIAAETLATIDLGPEIDDLVV